jgi:hypothetical protein
MVFISCFSFSTAGISRRGSGTWGNWVAFSLSFPSISFCHDCAGFFLSTCAVVIESFLYLTFSFSLCVSPDPFPYVKKIPAQPGGQWGTDVCRYLGGFGESV